MLILEECKRSNTHSNSLWDRSLEHKILFKKKNKSSRLNGLLFLPWRFSNPQLFLRLLVSLSWCFQRLWIRCRLMSIASFTMHFQGVCLKVTEAKWGGQIHSLRFVGIFCQFSSSFACKSKKKCLGKLFHVFQSC